MTALVYPAKVVRPNLKRYDTDDGWVIAGSDVDVAAASNIRSGSPVRDTWTILSEGQKNVEMSYRTALAATPSTTCPTPDLDGSPFPKTPSRPQRAVLSGKSSSKKKAVVELPPAPPAPQSSDEDACGGLYQLRKGRVAGSGSNKSRHNKKK